MSEIRRLLAPLFVALLLAGALGFGPMASAAEKDTCIKSAADVVSDEEFQKLYVEGL